MLAEQALGAGWVGAAKQDWACASMRKVCNDSLRVKHAKAFRALLPASRVLQGRFRYVEDDYSAAAGAAAPGAKPPGVAK